MTQSENGLTTFYGFVSLLLMVLAFAGAGRPLVAVVAIASTAAAGGGVFQRQGFEIVASHADAAGAEDAALVLRARAVPSRCRTGPATVGKVRITNHG